MSLSAKRIKSWYVVHKWTSLICTLFLLVCCISGLPLVFNGEINDWLDDDPSYAVVPPDQPLPRIDLLVDLAQQRYPGQQITTIFADTDEPQVIIEMVPSREAVKKNPSLSHWLKFDRRTGDLLEESNSPGEAKKEQPFLGRLMSVMLHLHVDLYAELPGQLFLGFMGLMFFVAVVSGIVLYGPFMKRIPFGTVRAERSPRIKWLDLHNLLGIVTLAWALVVGATGVLNELTLPLFRLWMATDVRQALTTWNGQPIPEQSKMASVQGAYDAVKAALPGKVVETMIFPNDEFGSPHHYLFWTKGDSPLTSRVFDGALVDARTGQLSMVLTMPWYLRALQVSRPLHFGDYAGLPLKILWIVLDLITIFVMGSGLYLWFARSKAMNARIAQLARSNATTSHIGLDKSIL